VGFSFKKLAKGALKLGGKIAKQALSTTPVGMAALKAQQALKSVGANLKAARLGKIEPVSVQAVASKIATPLAKKTITLRPRLSDGPRGLQLYDSSMPMRAPRKPAKGKTAAKSAVYTRGKNKGKKRRVITAPPSAKQIAARAKFAAAAAARRRG